jgi:hypothetical protein
METNNLNKKAKWLIKIVSKQMLSNKESDFFVELISEEARKTRAHYSFILHDVVESDKYSQLFIEGTKTALSNLLSVCKDNLTYKISYTRYGE